MALIPYLLTFSVVVAVGRAETIAFVMTISLISSPAGLKVTDRGFAGTTAVFGFTGFGDFTGRLLRESSTGTTVRLTAVDAGSSVS